MSSPFAQAADLMTTVAAQAALLTTTRIHPGEGDIAERADDLAASTAQRAILTEDWLTDTAALAEGQAATDAGLMAAPSPADLSAWHRRINAGGMDAATKQAEIHLFLQAAKQRREALDAHTAETITEVPELPASVCTVPVTDGGAEGSGNGESLEVDSADGDRLGEDEDASTAPESSDEAPVSMTNGSPETPRVMSTGTTGRETPTPLSDTSAGTELSSSAMAADPAARTALGQPMGQGTPQVSFAQQPPASTTGIPVSQQLSQNTAQRAAGTPRTGSRNEPRRRDDQDTPSQAVGGVGLAGTGTMAAMASSPSSPGTTTSAAPVAPAATPNAAPTNPAPGAAPVGGTGTGGGLGRGGTLGSGSNVKPIISTEQPPTPQLTPEEQRLLDEYDKKDGTK